MGRKNRKEEWKEGGMETYKTITLSVTENKIPTIIVFTH